MEMWGLVVSDPDVELEIKKSSANTTLAINAATAANDAQLKFRTGDADDFTIYVDGSATNDPLHFYDHASSTNMMTLVNGNVGIGTTSPSRQFTVENTIANSGGVIGLTSSDSSTSGTCGIIHFGNSTDSSIASINGIADGANDAGALLFKTEATGEAIEERIYF